MKTLIACTDFSDSGAHAVQYGAALAQALGARLVLFHYFVYPVPATDMPSAFPDAFVDEMTSGYEAQLEELKRQLLQKYTIEISCVVRSWDFATDLETVFEAEKAELVLMGIRGQSPVLNTIMGSYTAATIRRGKLPLLVVPKGALFQPYRKILFPCDNHHIQHSATIKPMLQIALHFDAYIEVFSLFEWNPVQDWEPEREPAEVKNNIDALLEGTRHGYAYENDPEVEKGILYEASRSASDLVAMIPHHHTFWSNLMNRSKTQKIAVEINFPLLVLPERRL